MLKHFILTNDMTYRVCDCRHYCSHMKQRVEEHITKLNTSIGSPIVALVYNEAKNRLFQGHLVIGTYLKSIYRGGSEDAIWYINTDNKDVVMNDDTNQVRIVYRVLKPELDPTSFLTILDSKESLNRKTVEVYTDSLVPYVAYALGMSKTLGGRITGGR